MEFSLQFLHAPLSWCCDISHKLNQVWIIRTENVKVNRLILQFHNLKIYVFFKFRLNVFLLNTNILHFNQLLTRIY